MRMFRVIKLDGTPTFVFGDTFMVNGPWVLFQEHFDYDDTDRAVALFRDPIAVEDMSEKTAEAPEKKAGPMMEAPLDEEITHER